MRGKDGVVFAVEYGVTSKLHEKEPYHRIFNIDKHIGMVAAGLIADGRMVGACSACVLYPLPLSFDSTASSACDVVVYGG